MPCLSLLQQPAHPHLHHHNNKGEGKGWQVGREQGREGRALYKEGEGERRSLGLDTWLMPAMTVLSPEGSHAPYMAILPT